MTRYTSPLSTTGAQIIPGAPDSPHTTSPPVCVTRPGALLSTLTACRGRAGRAAPRPPSGRPAAPDWSGTRGAETRSHPRRPGLRGDGRERRQRTPQRQAGWWDGVLADCSSLQLIDRRNVNLWSKAGGRAVTCNNANHTTTLQLVSRPELYSTAIVKHPSQTGEPVTVDVFCVEHLAAVMATIC